jgi:hypothetical protein
VLELAVDSVILPLNMLLPTLNCVNPDTLNVSVGKTPERKLWYARNSLAGLRTQGSDPLKKLRNTDKLARAVILHNTVGSDEVILLYEKSIDCSVSLNCPNEGGIGPVK